MLPTRPLRGRGKRSGRDCSLCAPCSPQPPALCKSVALLRRIDTKYVLHTQQLFQALENLKDQYRILEIQGCRLNRYHNLYFDTPDFELYHQHHKQQRNRYKVRCREYVDTQLTYLEVKRKNNRDQTIKSRLKTGEFISDLSQKGQHFLSENYPYERQYLQPVLWNDFMRITLVSKWTVVAGSG